MKSRAQRYRYVRHVVSGTRPSPWSPLSLGSSLAAWYKADAGCYTDAACLFASASSQYLSKTSPTFAPTTKMTIAFDYKPTAIGVTQDLVALWQPAGDQRSFIVRLGSGGRVSIIMSSNGVDSANEYETTDVLTAGVNSRVVLVYDGTLAAANRVVIYADGVQMAGAVASGTIPASVFASTGSLVVGRVGDVGANYADGAMARLGFSSLALSGAALTAAHTSTFWADMTSARQADWFSFYNLCEASSTRVDSTGLNNLTPTNGPTVAAGPGEGAAVNLAPVKRRVNYGTQASNAVQATIASQPTLAVDVSGTRDAVLYDGTDDVLIATGAVPAIGTGDFTVASRIKTRTLANDYKCIWRLHTNLGFYIKNNKLTLYAFAGDNLFTLTVAQNTEYALVLVRNSGTVTLYVNGVADATTPTVSDSVSAGDLQFGAEAGSVNPASHYDFEQIFMARAATASEVASMSTYLTTA